MRYRRTNDGTFPLIIVDLNREEKIRIERGSMVFHNGKVSFDGEMNSQGIDVFDKFVKSVGRSMVSGESFFITKVTGLEDAATLAIAPASIGDIKELVVGEKQWYINDGSFLACDESVSYRIGRQSIGKAMFAGTGGLFIMKTQGNGSMLVNSFGDILEIDLDGSSPFIVDNSHVVAWEDTLTYSIKVASGTFGYTTGEGLVNEFNGSGKIFIQTRHVMGLARLLAPFLVKSN